MAALSDEDVGRLDIAMNDAFGVRCIEGVGDFDCHREQHFRFQGAARDAMLQGHSVQKLHGDERMALVLADVMNRANVRVIQGGGSLRFALETSQSLRVFGHFVGQKFQGDEAVQAGVFGFIDHSHAAAAELLDDPIMRDGLAEQWKSLQPRASMLGRLARGSQRNRHARDQQPLLQLGVFSFRFFEDGNIGVGVLPEGEEVLIGAAAFRRITGHRVRARQTEMGQRAGKKIPHDAAVVEHFLKLGSRLAAFVLLQVGLAAKISRIQSSLCHRRRLA